MILIQNLFSHSLDHIDYSNLSFLNNQTNLTNDDEKTSNLKPLIDEMNGINTSTENSENLNINNKIQSTSESSNSSSRPLSTQNLETKSEPIKPLVET